MAGMEIYTNNILFYDVGSDQKMISNSGLPMTFKRKEKSNPNPEFDFSFPDYSFSTPFTRWHLVPRSPLVSTKDLIDLTITFEMTATKVSSQETKQGKDIFLNCIL